MSYEMMMVLVVSTGHVTEAESKLFETSYAELPGNLSSPMIWEYGWMFYIGGRGDSIVTDDLSPGLAGVINAAWDNKVEWVRFDTDGPVLDNIPTYDW